jgi:hypothetical protein
MHASLRCVGSLIVCGSIIVVVGTSPAFASDEKAPPRAVQGAGGGQQRPAAIYEGTHLAGFAQAAALPFVGVYATIGGLTLGGGIQFNYVSQGIPEPSAPPGTPSNVHTSFGLHVYGSYMVHDVLPFATGPEFTWATSVAPDAFQVNVLLPGWAFWYAPFPAPLLVGTAMNANLTFLPGGEYTLGLATPGLRLAWLFL